MSLNPKQGRFVAEYLLDLNATQAAIRAGYSPRTAYSQGQRLLKDAEILAAVAVAQAKRSEEVGVDADRVIREAACLAFYDPGEIASVPMNGPADIAKLPERLRRAIIGWSWDKFGNFVLKLAPKTPSLELIGRHLGMFKDRLDLTSGDKPLTLSDFYGRTSADQAAGPQSVQAPNPLPLRSLRTDHADHRQHAISRGHRRTPRSAGRPLSHRLPGGLAHALA